jgi:hypothetical protein
MKKLVLSLQQNSRPFQTVLEEYNTHVCQCKTDGCNGAESINLSFALMTATVAMAAYFAH